MSMIALLFAGMIQASSPSHEADVAAVLDQLNAASAAADGPAYFALFTPDARFVGTDASEHWTLSEFQTYAGPVFARGRGWSYPATERTITIAPIDCRCIAWFEEKLINDNYGVTRGSGVLRLTDDGWKIEQYVLSFAVPNDRVDEVVAAMEEKAQDAVPEETPQSNANSRAYRTAREAAEAADRAAAQSQPGSSRND